MESKSEGKERVKRIWCNGKKFPFLMQTFCLKRKSAKIRKIESLALGSSAVPS